MKLNVLRLWIIAALTLSTPAMGGPGSSGGGNSVVCFESVEQREMAYAALIKSQSDGINGVNPFADPSILNKVVTVEALDLYIHKLPRGRSHQEYLSLVQVDASISANDIVKRLIDRLSEKSSLADEISRKLDQIPASNWISSAGVTRISDAGTPLLFSPNCLVAQIAYRQGNQVFYDQQLYSKMTEVNKAVLILHEMLYAIAKEFGAQTAASVYPVISLILRSDEEFENWGAIPLNMELLGLGEGALFKLSARYRLTLGATQFPVTQIVTAEGPGTTRVDRRIYDRWTSMVFGGLHLEVPSSVELTKAVPENLPNYATATLLKANKLDLCVRFAIFSGCQIYAKELEAYEINLAPVLVGSGLNRGVTGRGNFTTRNWVTVEVSEGCSLDTLNGDLNLYCTGSPKIEVEPNARFFSRKVQLSQAVFGIGGQEDAVLKAGVLSRPIRYGVRKIPAGTRVEFDGEGRIKIPD